MIYSKKNRYIMVETRIYKNGKLILEDNLDIFNIPELSIYIKIFWLFIIIEVVLGILWITAFILLGVLTISDMRVETAFFFLIFGSLIHGIGTFIFINPFLKYSRIIHGVGRLTLRLRLSKFRNFYLSHPNQKKLNNLLEEVKSTKFRLRILVCLIGILMSIVSIILFVVFVVK